MTNFCCEINIIIIFYKSIKYYTRLVNFRIQMKIKSIEKSKLPIPQMCLHYVEDVMEDRGSRTEDVDLIPILLGMVFSESPAVN